MHEYTTIIIIILLSADIIGRTKASFEAEMEEREGYAYWDVWIPKGGDIQGEDVHWRGDGIYEGQGKSDGL